MPQNAKGSISSGIGWMFLLLLLLFWLPLIGPLLAGAVGGKKAGGVGNALGAVFLPAIVSGVSLFALATTLSGALVIGVVAGARGVVLALAHIGPLLLGAIVGGAVA